MPSSEIAKLWDRTSHWRRTPELSAEKLAQPRVGLGALFRLVDGGQDESQMYPQRNHQALGRGVAFDTLPMLSVERLTQPRVGPGALVRSRDVGQVESRMSRQRNRQPLGRNLIAYTDIQQIQLQIYSSGVSQKSSSKKVLGSVFFSGLYTGFPQFRIPISS